jgi:hypothetical protein
MDGAAMAPPRTASRQVYLILTILLGIAGSLGAVAAFGEGEYRVGPMLVRMKVIPASKGTTKLAVEYAQAGLTAGGAKTKTHAGFLALEADVTGIVGQANATAAVIATKDPSTLAKTIRDQGKDAFRKFAIRLGLVTVGGGAAGGFLLALVGLKTRRLFQGAVAGVLVVAVLGLIAWQTYDIKKLDGVQFVKPSVELLRR